MINDVIYAELAVRYDRIEDLEAFVDEAGLEMAPIPRAALFLAGKVFTRYRRSGGSRTGVLPDFFIGAHAAVCERIFEEKASGAQRERPALKEAIAFLREGDTLVVWKLDRLARSLRQLIDTIETLEERGIGLRSLTENIDTTTSGGRLVFHIFGALAEFERSIIRERTTAGLASARARGRLGGRPRAMTPEDVAIAKTLLANPEISVKEIARRQGVSVSTLYKHIPAARSAGQATDGSGDMGARDREA